MEIDQIVKYQQSDDGLTTATVSLHRLFAYAVEDMHTQSGAWIRQLSNNLRFNDVAFYVYQSNEGAYVEEGDVIASIWCKYIAEEKPLLLSTITLKSKVPGFVQTDESGIGHLLTATNNTLFTVSEQPNINNSYLANERPGGSHYSVRFIPEAYDEMMLRNIWQMDKTPKRPIILDWHVMTGDMVKKNQLLCTIDTPFSSYPVLSKYDGCIAIEKLEAIPNLDDDDEIGLHKYDRLYTLYQDLDTMVNIRYSSNVSFQNDYFTGRKVMVWNNMASRNIEGSDNEYYDCFEMGSDEGQHILLSLSYFDNHCQIVFGSRSKEIRLSKGNEAILLLRNPATGNLYNLNFSLDETYADSKHNIFDIAYSSVLPLEALEELSIYDCIGWRIKTAKRIFEGKNDSAWTPYIVARKVLRQVVTEYINCLSSCGVLNRKDDVNPEKEDSTSPGPYYVYLIHDFSSGFYKFGISGQPGKRSTSGIDDAPDELICVKEYPTHAIASAIAFALRSVFENEQLPGGWFDLSDKDVEDLKNTLN